MGILLAAIAALSYYVSRRAAKAQLQDKILSRLVAFARDRAVSRVQSAVNLSSMDQNDPSSPSIPRSKSLMSLGTILEEGNDNAAADDEGSTSTRSLSRKPSELALSELAHTHALCEVCLSRAASSVDLQTLDKELGTHGSDDELTAVTSSSSISSLSTTAGHRITTVSTTGGLGVGEASTGALVCGACDDECEVCVEASASWRTFVRRALGASLGASLGYVLWLRFVASKETARRHLFALVRFIGERVFQYKVCGAERIPKVGPALLCAYHGFIPLDMYFFHEYIARVTGRIPTTLVADFVFRIPLFSYFVRVCGGVPARRDAALNALKGGGLVLVAPGGVREAMTSSAEDYLVRWFGRTGFAETARLAGAPVVPMFTEQIREVFLVLGGSNKLVQWLYKVTRFPFTPFIGPLPQPLTSVVGAPISPGKGASKEELAHRVRLAMEALMRRQRQRLVA